MRRWGRPAGAPGRPAGQPQCAPPGRGRMGRHAAAPGGVRRRGRGDGGRRAAARAARRAGALCTIGACFGIALAARSCHTATVRVFCWCLRHMLGCASDILSASTTCALVNAVQRPPCSLSYARTDCSPFPATFPQVWAQVMRAGMRRGQRAAGGRRGGGGGGGRGLAGRVAAGRGGAAGRKVRRRHRGDRAAEGADTGAPRLGAMRLGAAAQLASARSRLRFGGRRLLTWTS
jgi:hypothetical protein